MSDERLPAGDAVMVRYERDGDVTVITLDRSPVNVYDDAFHVEFQDAWQRAKTDDSRVVVMRATGQALLRGRQPQESAAGASRRGRTSTA